MSITIPKRLQGKTPSHARAPQQEKAIAKRIGGSLVKGSGCGSVKGDVRLRGFVRVEAKTTKNDSFRVTTELVEKLESAVFGSGEIPIMQVELASGKARILVMPDWALDLIVEAIRGRDTESDV